MTIPGQSRSARQQTVTRMLRQARARRDPRDIHGFALTFGEPEGRAKPGLTQQETARLLGVSARWYRDLELGKPLNYSLTFLTAVRRTLALENDEWEVLRRLTHDHVPDSGDAPEAGTLVRTKALPETIRTFVQAQQCAAYLCDHRWDILTYNNRAVADFPWMLYGTNIMEWALTYPEARTQLIEWEEDWAKPMIAQLRLHGEQWSTDHRIKTVIHAVQADPEVRRLWNSPNLPTLSHPDAAAPRRLYLPRHGTSEFRVTLLTMAPLDSPTHRLMAILPA